MAMMVGGLVILLGILHTGVCYDYRLYALDAYGSLNVLNGALDITETYNHYYDWHDIVQMIGFAIDPHSIDTPDNVLYAFSGVVANASYVGYPIMMGHLGHYDERVVFWAHAYEAYVDRMVFEPVTMNLYFTAVNVFNSTECFIGVLTPDFEFHMIVQHLSEPRDLEIDPKRRMLYYTVWGGDAPYIGWSYLDGSESGPLIGPRTDIGWPNGLALDLYGDYLYWSDGMMHTVNRFDLKTQTSKQILPDNGNSQYMDIAFDGGYLYLLDWTVPNVVISFHPDHVDITGHQSGDLPVGRLDTLALVTDYLRDIPVIGDCAENNGRGTCSNICLPSKEGHTCACQEGVSLKKNQKTCMDALGTCTEMLVGVDFSRCYGHDGETCSVECIPGFSVTAPFMTEPTITCTSGQWDNTEPCRFDYFASDFRMFLTDKKGMIYGFDESFHLTDMIDIKSNHPDKTAVQVVGIGVDPWETLNDQAGSFVYSTIETSHDNTTIGNTYRHYLGNSKTEFLFSTSNKQDGAFEDRFAIDPSSGNIFSTSVINTQDGSRASFLSVSSPELRHSKIFEGLNKPRDIIIHLARSIIFWTDWAEFYIGVANLDGSNAGMFAYVDYGWLNGLAIDYTGSGQTCMSMPRMGSQCIPRKCLFYYGRVIPLPDDRLYWTWTNGDYSLIQSAQLDDLLVATNLFLNGSHFQDILIDGETIYFLDWLHPGLHYYRKPVDINEKISPDVKHIEGAIRLDAMAVFSDYTRSIPVSNQCIGRSFKGQCSDICLPTQNGPACTCDDGDILLDNGKTCNNATLCPVISNGVLQECDRHDMDSCEFNCYAGHTKSASLIECSKGQWDVADPCIIQQCKAEVVNNAHMSGSEAVYGSTIEYECEFGSIKTGGDLVRKCQENGVLSGEPPICTAIECPEIENGYLQGCNRHHLDSCFVDCLPGYSAIYSSILCDYGQWDVANPCKQNCKADNVTNAQVLSERDVLYDHIVEYDCELGYIHEGGDLVRICQDNGALSGEPPICTAIECPAIEYGDLPGCNRHHNAMCDVECFPGYSAISHNIWCHLGLWDIENPCKQNCIADNVTNAHVLSVRDVLYDHTVEYDCEPGYIHEGGDLVRICQDNGVLSGEPPICTAIECPAIENGDLPGCNRHHNAMCGVECFPGYSAISHNILCHLGLWDIGNPCKQNCIADGDTNAHLLTEGEVVYNSTIEYICETGYKHTGGELVRTCQDNGVLSGEPPICTAIECQAIENGDLLGCKRHHNDFCDVDCFPGYSAISHHIYCDLGLWDIENPCKQNCIADNVTNAHLLTEGEVVYDSNIEYICQTGYKHTGGELVRICQDDGVLSGEPPICTAIECPEIENGYLQRCNRHHLDSCVVDCLPGYSAIFSSILCDYGQWDVANPCKQNCIADNVTNAQVLSVRDVLYDHTVEYDCEPGYLHEGGDLVRTCQDNGVLSGEPPICIAIECPAIENGDLPGCNRHHNAMCDVECFPGYSAISHNIWCHLGLWDIENPCKQNCIADGDTNAHLLTEGEVVYDSIIEYICQTGYKHTGGELVRTCQDNGLLSGEPPICTAIKCPAIENGDLLECKRHHNDFCGVECFPGYSAISPYIRCDLGLWDIENPCKQNCIADYVTYAHMLYEGDVVYNSTIEYICEIGYKHTGGELVRTCQDNGILSGEPPICTVIECTAEASSPLNYFVNDEGIYHGVTVHYYCETGYELRGDRNRTCLASGELSGLKPECIVQSTTIPTTESTTTIPTTESTTTIPTTESTTTIPTSDSTTTIPTTESTTTIPTTESTTTIPTTESTTTIPTSDSTTTIPTTEPTTTIPTTKSTTTIPTTESTTTIPTTKSITSIPTTEPITASPTTGISVTTETQPGTPTTGFSATTTTEQIIELCNDETLTKDGQPNWVSKSSTYFDETQLENVVSGNVVTYDESKRRPRLNLLPKNRRGEDLYITELSIEAIQGVKDVQVSDEIGGISTACDTILNGTKWVVKWEPPKIVDLVLVIIVRQDLTKPLQFSNVTLKGCVKEVIIVAPTTVTEATTQVTTAAPASTDTTTTGSDVTSGELTSASSIDTTEMPIGCIPERILQEEGAHGLSGSSSYFTDMNNILIGDQAIYSDAEKRRPRFRLSATSSKGPLLFTEFSLVAIQGVKSVTVSDHTGETYTVLADDTARFVQWPSGIITDYLEVIVVRENLITDLIISEVTLIGCVEETAEDPSATSTTVQVVTTAPTTPAPTTAQVVTTKQTTADTPTGQAVTTAQTTADTTTGQAVTTAQTTAGTTTGQAVTTAQTIADTTTGQAVTTTQTTMTPYICTDERLTPDGRPNWIKGTSNYFNETLIVSGDVVKYNDDKVRRPRMTLLPKNRYGDVVSVTEFSIKTIQGVNTIVVSYEKNGTTTALIISKDDDDVWTVVFDPPVEFDSLLVIIVRAGLTTDAKFSDVTLKGCVKELNDEPATTTTTVVTEAPPPPTTTTPRVTEAPPPPTTTTPRVTEAPPRVTTTTPRVTTTTPRATTTSPRVTTTTPRATTTTPRATTTTPRATTTTPRATTTTPRATTTTPRATTTTTHTTTTTPRATTTSPRATTTSPRATTTTPRATTTTPRATTTTPRATTTTPRATTTTPRATTTAPRATTTPPRATTTTPRATTTTPRATETKPATTTTPRVTTTTPRATTTTPRVTTTTPRVTEAPPPPTTTTPRVTEAPPSPTTTTPRVTEAPPPRTTTTPRVTEAPPPPTTTTPRVTEAPPPPTTTTPRVTEAPPPPTTTTPRVSEAPPPPTTTTPRVTEAPPPPTTTTPRVTEAPPPPTTTTPRVTEAPPPPTTTTPRVTEAPPPPTTTTPRVTEAPPPPTTTTPRVTEAPPSPTTTTPRATTTTPRATETKPATTTTPSVTEAPPPTSPKTSTTSSQTTPMATTELSTDAPATGPSDIPGCTGEVQLKPKTPGSSRWLRVTSSDFTNTEGLENGTDVQYNAGKRKPRCKVYPETLSSLVVTELRIKVGSLVEKVTAAIDGNLTNAEVKVPDEDRIVVFKNFNKELRYILVVLHRPDTTRAITCSLTVKACPIEVPTTQPPTTTTQPAVTTAPQATNPPTTVAQGQSQGESSGTIAKPAVILMAISIILCFI